jgi:hypothetical protein
MTRILRDLSIPDAPTVVRFGDRHVTLQKSAPVAATVLDTTQRALVTLWVM